MKVALRHNFPATARAMGRGLAIAAANAAEQTADAFGRDSQKELRTRMVQTGLGKMAGAIRYQSSLKKRRGRNRVQREFGGRGTSALTAIVRRNAWSVVWNANSGDRSTGAFDAYSARSLTTIKPKGGKRWLAFPVGPVPRRAGRLKMTPALYNRSGLAQSIGPLFFLKGVSPNVAYLAVKNISVTGKTASKPKRLGKSGGAGAGRVKKDLIIMFILIRATTRNRRIDPVAVLERQMGPALIRFGTLMSQQTQNNPVPTEPLISRSGTGSAALGTILRV